MNEEMKQLLSKPVLTIPEAGKVLGMCRNNAYAAARSGHIPTIQVSEKLQRVPSAALRKMLGVEAA
jgi:hypothetical protein